MYNGGGASVSWLPTVSWHSDARVAMTDETFPILSWLFSHGEDTVRSVNIRPWGSYTG